MKGSRRLDLLVNGQGVCVSGMHERPQQPVLNSVPPRTQFVDNQLEEYERRGRMKM